MSIFIPGAEMFIPFPQFEKGALCPFWSVAPTPITEGKFAGYPTELEESLPVEAQTIHPLPFLPFDTALLMALVTALDGDPNENEQFIISAFN